MNIFKYHKISDSLYIIAEAIDQKQQSLMSFALVIGKEKAAIIDTGFGLTGNLKEFIQTITNKPIICLLTHGDPDHVGGSGQFSTVYMNTKDEDLANEAMDPKLRLLSAKLFSENNEELIKYAETHITSTPDNKMHYLPIQNEQHFDLGEVSIEAIYTPGHSQGSVCFYNEKDNYLISGDSIAVKTFAQLAEPRCTSLDIYLDSLEKVKQRIKTDTKIYSGHRLDAFPYNFIPNMIICCKDLLATKGKNDKPYVMRFKEMRQDNLNPRVHQLSNSEVSIQYLAVPNGF